jgi:ribosomal protein L11 methylase PrmA
MLELAQVKPGDVVYDLGSGDGRIVITAAQRFGARAVGVELDPELVARSRANAQRAGVADRVRFLQQDLFTADLGEATVVTLYLLPDVNLRLRPKLRKELRPGSRIVSHDYDLGDWIPDKTAEVSLLERNHLVFLWHVRP